MVHPEYLKLNVSFPTAQKCICYLIFFQVVNCYGTPENQLYKPGIQSDHRDEGQLVVHNTVHEGKLIVHNTVHEGKLVVTCTVHEKIRLFKSGIHSEHGYNEFFILLNIHLIHFFNSITSPF